MSSDKKEKSINKYVKFNYFKVISKKDEKIGKFDFTDWIKSYILFLLNTLRSMGNMINIIFMTDKTEEEEFVNSGLTSDEERKRIEEEYTKNNK